MQQFQHFLLPTLDKKDLSFNYSIGYSVTHLSSLNSTLHEMALKRCVTPSKTPLNFTDNL